MISLYLPYESIKDKSTLCCLSNRHKSINGGIYRLLQELFSEIPTESLQTHPTVKVTLAISRAFRSAAYVVIWERIFIIPNFKTHENSKPPLQNPFESAVGEISVISTPSSHFAVFDHLFKFKQLTTLCYITSSEYQLNCLLKEVKQLPLLLHLVLGGNAINNNTLYKLSVDLSGVSSLETFGLTHKAQFKGPGVLKMIGRIQFWSGTLKRLTFSGAIVHSVGVVALICNALSSLEKLEALCLSYTDLDSGTVMNIVDKYNRYPWLKFLDFTGCQQTTNSRNFIKKKSAEFPNLLIKM